MTSGSYCESIPASEFTIEMFDSASFGQLTIVGSRYRNHMQHQVLANKNAKTLVLLVREPGNPADPNAVACLMTKQVEYGDDLDNTFTWVHVGYLPQNTAAKLATHWPTKNGLPMAIHATLRDGKIARQKLGIIHLDPTNDGSTSLRGRDMSQFL